MSGGSASVTSQPACRSASAARRTAAVTDGAVPPPPGSVTTATRRGASGKGSSTAGTVSVSMPSGPHMTE